MGATEPATMVMLAIAVIGTVMVLAAGAVMARRSR